MNRLLIATHSELAEGFAKAVRFFINDADNVDFLNCYVENNEIRTQLEEKIAAYEKDNLIVLTDIAGGSVNQIAAELLKKYHFKLVSGINLAMLLELVFCQGDVTIDQLEKIVEKARSQMAVFIPENLAAEEDASEEL